MATYKLSKEWIKDHGELIKEAYSSAKARGLDISSSLDVLTLIKIVDPENANEENAKLFSKILQLFSNEAKQVIEKRYVLEVNKKEKIIN